ncbi:MAG: ATP-binding protein [Acidobacteriota bacterium]
MNLRTKLLVGYAVFIIALVALGGWSAWRLHVMAGVTRLILSNNYDSVIAAQEMKETLERQDSAATFLLLGQRERALAQLSINQAAFNKAFNEAAGNITEPKEPGIINGIRRDRDEYYRRFQTFIMTTSTPQTTTSARERYFQQLEPLFHHLRGECNELLHVNQAAMRAKSESAVRAAQRWFWLTAVIAGALILAGIALAVFLAERIVRPVRELTEDTARIAGGNLDVRAEIRSRDEIGLLAAEFNRMAERIRQLRRSDMGRLMLAQQTTEAAIDSLYDPVIVTDAEGNVTKFNAAAADIFGQPEYAIGKPIEEITHDKGIATAVREAIQSERPVASESAPLLLPLQIDGKQRAFRLRTTPMRDNDLRLLGAVTLLEDITHLREIDRIKSEFIATATSELRTPLDNLRMGIHVLVEGAAGEMTDQQTDVLYSCRENSDRLDRLMRDLLDLSSLESGEYLPKPAPLNLAHLLRSVVESLRPQVESKNIAFKVELPFDLPPVMADGQQISRVLTHLISNAMKCTPVEGEIQLTASASDGSVAVSVSDTGCGIPKDYLPRIFDKFVKVPDSPQGGVGLGLAITRKLVEMQGGQISVQSEVGQGTTFTFTLPAAKEVVASKSSLHSNGF